MSKLAKEALEQIGQEVRQKLTLNRCILDQASRASHELLDHKIAYKSVGPLCLVRIRAKSVPSAIMSHPITVRAKRGLKYLACDYEDHVEHIGSMNTLERGLRLLACGAVAPSRSMKQEPTEALEP